MEQTKPRSVVVSLLPWLAAAALLVFYLFTLNKHVTLSSVSPLARINGMDWQPTYLSPFTWLVTLPARWLPAGMQLFALNFISALAGALTLGLLARSVAIWPHDRTHEQRVREQSDNSLLSLPTAWIPPVFAVLLLGFQRSFWENSIICTGEILDTLLMAYIVRCLLEYRLEDRDSWLWKMALACGIGITNSFAFIGFFPALLVAVIWVKGLRFFNFSFLARMMLFGLAGLSLYFVLPVVQSMNEAADVTFWDALKKNLGYQKNMLLAYPRWRAIWLGGYPLVMVLIAGIKWSSGFGDTSRIGSIFGTMITHVVHLALLGFGVYMMFDPPGSPRQFGLGLPFLGSYYLTALACGYFAGYLLLVFSDFSTKTRRWGAMVMVPLSFLITAVVCTTALVAPVKLALGNWRRVRAINAPEFRDYTKRLAESLPRTPCVVLSDDPFRLYCVAMQVENARNYVFIDTRSLSEPAYHRVLRSRYGDLIPAVKEKAAPLPGYINVQLLTALKQKRELFYLHPSFGYFFETFYQEPRGLVYRIETHASDAIDAPAPAPQAVAEMSRHWAGMYELSLRSLGERVGTMTPDEKSLYADLLFAGRCYSHGMNVWGVELQRAGNFDEAAKFFEQALVVNPDNTSAYINREFNTRWRKEGKTIEEMGTNIMLRLQGERGIEGLLNGGGPVDDPAFRLELGNIFARNQLWRQAAQHLNRCLAYKPGDVQAAVMLANVFLGWNQPDRALKITADLRAKHPAATTAPEVQIEILRTEAGAYLDKNEFPAAEKIFLNAERQFPEQDGSYLTLAQLYLAQSEKLRLAGDAAGAARMVTNALQVSERHIQYLPQSAAAWFIRGNLFMHAGAPALAVPAYSKVLAGDPKNSAALMNRAIANLQAKNYDAAQKDYEAMLGFTLTSYRVFYGLAEVAYQKQDWKAAREYCKKYLDFAPANSPEASFIRTRIEELRKK
jgi:tetratricopeptide (TPR) repeat protein